MTTFVLVHDAWHGGWCWERLAPLLQQAGHDVVVPELPTEDGSADFDAYADVVCTDLRGCDDDIVVVAHSLAGATGALVPDLAIQFPDVSTCLSFHQVGDDRPWWPF